MPYLPPEMISAAQGNFTPAQPPPPNASMSSMPLDPMASFGGMPLEGGASYAPNAGMSSGPPPQAPPPPAPSFVGPPPMDPQQVDAARGLFTAPEPNSSQAEPIMSQEPPPPPPAPPPQSIAPVTVVGARSAAQGAPAGSGGGGMGKLQANVNRDRAALLGTYDASADAQNEEGRAQAMKGVGVADMLDAQARLQEEHAAISREEVRQAHDKHAEYMAGTQRLIDDVASQKVDPNRLFHSGDASRDMTVGIAAMLIGGLGGFAAASTGRNPGLEAINTMIDRDIATQEKNIANKRTAIGARQSMYGQMREELGDKMLADDKFRIAALEAAKNRILAFSAGADAKTDVARSNAALAQITREQAKTQSSFSERALEVAKAQAAAGAAAAAHRAQQQFENVIKVRQLELEGRKVDVEANKALNGGKPPGATDFDKQRAEYAQQLQKAGLPVSEAQIEALKRTLPKPGEDIPGLGIGSRIKSTLARAATFGVGGEAADAAVLSKDELVNQKHVGALYAQYTHALTGAGMSEKEADRIAKTFYGARTSAELWDTIAMADDALKTQKANFEAGYGPEVVQSYNANMQGSSRPPIPSFKPGLK